MLRDEDITGKEPRYMIIVRHPNEEMYRLWSNKLISNKLLIIGEEKAERQHSSKLATCQFLPDYTLL